MVSRLVIAIIGITFFVILILTMSFDPSRTKNLVATCTFVFVFACALATNSRIAEQELLATTAACAAILVVFVGAITAPSSLG